MNCIQHGNKPVYFMWTEFTSMAKVYPHQEINMGGEMLNLLIAMEYEIILWYK